MVANRKSLPAPSQELPFQVVLKVPVKFWTRVFEPVQLLKLQILESTVVLEPLKEPV